MSIRQPASLYDRIGGDYTINAVVDSFYEKVLSDNFLKPFFEGICMNAQMSKMKIFLTVAFGGGSEGTIQHMRNAHAHLVEQGLNDDHIDHMINHMRAALEGIKVENGLVTEAIDVVDSYRDEVLGR